MRDPKKTRKRSRSRTKRVTLIPAEKKKATKNTGEEEEPKTRKEAKTREDIIHYVDTKFVKEQRWKIEFDVPRNIGGNDLDMLFQEEEDKGKTRNHRTYIGPGADGSSDDKIAVEVRYNNINKKVSYSHQWKDYVKTTFVQYPGESWICKEVDTAIGDVRDVSEDGKRPERCAIFIQPQADDECPTAYFTTCTDHGLAAFEGIQSLRPDLEKDKKVTMSKKQRALVTKGEDK